MPVLICLREKLWTRTYFTRDQVPTCPVFTRAKIKSRFGILKNLLSQDAQPEAQKPTLLGDGFLCCILSATSLVPKLHRGSRGPFRPGVALPTSPRPSPPPTLTGTRTSVLTELYNSSTSTQSLTRFLESHVGSSSSGNNCHAVHRSLSSGASVYECTMGIFFISSHFISQFPPTRFPLITAIRMCHLLPVHHLGMAFLAGSKVKIQHMQRRFPFFMRILAPFQEIHILVNLLMFLRLRLRR